MEAVIAALAPAEPPPVTGVRSVAARLLILAALGRGESDEAQALAGEQLDLARRWGAASDIGAAPRLSARLGAGGRLDRLEDAPDRLRLARALVDLGAALRAVKRRTDARDHPHRAADLAGTCGAFRLRTHALDGLSALGDRPRRHMSSGTDGLTASERRVAELASEGRTDRDTAQDPLVSPKAVENHLGRVDMRPGVKGRHEMVAAMGGEPVHRRASSGTDPRFARSCSGAARSSS